MHSDKDRPTGQNSGQALFAIAFLLLSILLISQIGDQTKWVKKTKFFAQPRFWPAVGLGGMVLFSALHLWFSPKRRVDRADWAEAAVWLQALEFVLWFMAYVWLVPLVGYLPVTVIFVPVLLWRMGYRDRRLLLAGSGVGLATVVLFKTFLDVKIPGAALYEYLPGALRNFFILNF